MRVASVKVAPYPPLLFVIVMEALNGLLRVATLEGLRVAMSLLHSIVLNNKKGL